jgi:hypothetical protein
LPPSDRVIPALSPVHWYTQHPSRPAPPPLHQTEHVSIIGRGNVALDVARMLLTPPSSILEKYDVPASVLDVHRTQLLNRSSIYCIASQLKETTLMRFERSRLSAPQGKIVSNSHEQVQSVQRCRRHYSKVAVSGAVVVVVSRTRTRHSRPHEVLAKVVGALQDLWIRFARRWRVASAPARESQRPRIRLVFSSSSYSAFHMCGLGSGVYGEI